MFLLHFKTKCFTFVYVLIKTDVALKLKLIFNLA